MGSEKPPETQELSKKEEDGQVGDQFLEIQSLEHIIWLPQCQWRQILAPQRWIFLSNAIGTLPQNIVFLQNRAPQSCCSVVKYWLDAEVPISWICRGGRTLLQAGSPDLKVWDFSLLRQVKYKIYQACCRNRTHSKRTTYAARGVSS